jgi:hypothetical protein
VWGVLFDERTGLSFTYAASPRQRSNSRIHVPRDSWPYVSLSGSRPPSNLEGQVSVFVSLGNRVTTSPGTGFPFRRHVWFRKATVRYSNPPPGACCRHGRHIKHRFQQLRHCRWRVWRAVDYQLFIEPFPHNGQCLSTHVTLYNKERYGRVGTIHS